jgi:hypothetical protein
MRCFRDTGLGLRPHRNFDTFSAERGDFRDSEEVRCMMSFDKGNSSMLAKIFSKLYRESTELGLNKFRLDGSSKKIQKETLGRLSVFRLQGLLY